MKKQALCVGLALSAITLSSTTAQAELQQTATVKVDKSKAGTKKKPVGVKITVTTTTKETDPAKTAPGTTDVVLNFPPGFVFNGKLFPSCAASVMNGQGPAACPSGSKVGIGTATGVALGQTESLKITAFNGPGGNKLNVFIEGTSPLQIAQAMEGALAKTAGGGYKLSLKIPETLVHPLAGVNGVLAAFKVTVGGQKAKKHSYIESIGCKSKSWAYSAAFSFTEGSPITVKGKQACS